MNNLRWDLLFEKKAFFNEKPTPIQQAAISTGKTKRKKTLLEKALKQTGTGRSVYNPIKNFANRSAMR